MRQLVLKIFRLIPESRLFRLKVYMLNIIGHEIDKTVRLASSIKIYGNGKLIINENCWIGPNVKFYVNSSYILIEKNCDIAPEVSFFTGSHLVDKEKNKRIAGMGYVKPIIIKSNSWVCARATIHNGVVVPEKSILESGKVYK